MISNHDRSFWIGASDTSYVVGNWETKTFKKWWLEKLGLYQNTIQTKAMKCGNAYEHKILDAIGCGKDEQIIIPELRLRVNYDGIERNQIYEVKTFKDTKEFKVSKAYWRQVQVEGYVFLETTGIMPFLYIVAYPLSDREYKNYFTEIDKDKLQFYEIDYDEDFIEMYLERLKILVDCMDKGKMPRLEKKG